MFIKFTDLDLIRRYGAVKVNVDSGVARILLSKGYAVECEQKVEVKQPQSIVEKIESAPVSNIQKPMEQELTIFPSSIIVN